jgi:AraC-like DNA-binding protein
VEQDALALLGQVLAPAPSGAPRAAPEGARRRRALVEGARAILARDPGRAHPLADVARALDISPSHLAHVFRAEAGMPLHRWLLHLRLAVALERLADGDAHLSALALDLGFATHSHFSAAFRRWCGVTPAQARDVVRTRPL